MMTSSLQHRPTRRELVVSSLAGAAVLAPLPALAATTPVRFDRAAYDRYVRLMNAGDPRFAEYYADDIKFEMNIRGKAGVLNFYAQQWQHMKETLEVVFFCSDVTGAAAEVRSELRCIKDFDDTTIFGRALKAGEVQRVRGYVFYLLNPQGLITEVRGPPPEVLQPWRLEKA